eukprot:scaffold178030_cov21-Tisochrysis_lutea.AAC.1
MLQMVPVVSGTRMPWDSGVVNTVQENGMARESVVLTTVQERCAGKQLVGLQVLQWECSTGVCCARKLCRATASVQMLPWDCSEGVRGARQGHMVAAAAAAYVSFMVLLQCPTSVL